MLGCSTLVALQRCNLKALMLACQSTKEEDLVWSSQFTNVIDHGLPTVQLRLWNINPEAYPLHMGSHRILKALGVVFSN